jgi:hypothetical protein
VAEGVGFEPTEPEGSRHFECRALGRTMRSLQLHSTIVCWLAQVLLESERRGDEAPAHDYVLLIEDHSLPASDVSQGMGKDQSSPVPI